MLSAPSTTFSVILEGTRSREGSVTAERAQEALVQAGASWGCSAGLFLAVNLKIRSRVRPLCSSAVGFALMLLSHPLPLCSVSCLNLWQPPVHPSICSSFLVLVLAYPPWVPISLSAEKLIFVSC